MNSPLYAIVLALHVASAVTGFGTVALTGWYAAAARRAPAGRDLQRLERYFRPGRNWAARSLLLVPVFGATLIALGHGRDATRAWPWIGLTIWLTATAVASARVWPGERAIQAAVGAGQLGSGGSGEALARLCRQVERATAVTSLLFVAAVAVMVVQPG